MKTKLITSMILASAVCSTAAAQSASILPTGSYEFIGHECTSGQPAEPLAPPQMMESKMTANLLVKESTMDIAAQISYKLTKNFAEVSLENYEFAIEEAKKIEDPAERERELAIYVEMKEQVMKMIAGQTCNLNIKVGYSLDGSRMTSNATSVDVDCPEFDKEELLNQTKIQLVKFEGDVLKLETTADSSDARSEQCNANDDDRLVEVYKKTK